MAEEAGTLTEGFDSLPIPLLDDFVSDLPSDFCLNYDFDITFDDIENLYIPSDTEQSTLPDVSIFNSQTNSGDLDSDPSRLSDERHDVILHVDKYLNPSPSEEAGSCDSGGVRSPVLSHGSSAASETAAFDAAVIDQNIIGLEAVGDAEGTSKTSRSTLTKRKKETSDESGNSNKQKQRRAPENWNPQCTEELTEEDEKRRARLMRNRESAQLSRQRKKHYVEELEEKVRAMHSTIAELNGKISYFMAENTSLRQQLTASGNGLCAPTPPPPPPGTVYSPMLGYPWMPCAPPYVVKAQGSQVPLIPIPRLKPQPSPAAAKAKKRESSTKVPGKTKKVASVSFLGLLFFIFLFGVLTPMVDVKFGGWRNNNDGNGIGFVSDRSTDLHKGRVLVVDGNVSGSHKNVGVGAPVGRIDVGNITPGDRGVHSSNASEPLVASLYVPRNDKLIKIDGNLIIHSVLASERAMASDGISQASDTKETGLAIPRDLSQYLAITDTGSNRGRQPHLHQILTERRKALASASTDTLKDHLKSSAADGKVQQWFREGLAGPLLSSGTCSEVFQFDVSPTPGAIVPHSSVVDITAEDRRNVSHLNKGKNRRILDGVPVPLRGSNLNNITREHIDKSSQKNKFEGNKSVSSMVVSVLVDPREAGDGDVDSVITSKSLSRIFVVVLLDSVKYVTYSCVLPSSGPHLVTT